MDSNAGSVKDVPVIQVPDIDGPRNTAHTVIGDKIVFVSIEHDDDCGDPTDDYGMGNVYSFSHRHINSVTRERAQALVEKHGKDAVLLSYYEHGLCMWMVAGEAITPGVEFDWDGTRFAGLWIPDEGCQENATELPKDSPERVKQMREWAAACVETYTEWCNGECYGYDIRVFRVRKDDAGKPYDRLSDYRRDTPVADNSCWGYIGADAVKEGLDEGLAYVRTQL